MGGEGRDRAHPKPGGRKDDEPISAMNEFLDAAFRGQLPQAGILPGLILLFVFGILALGSRLISRPD